jgi:hypothetical protein
MNRVFYIALRLSFLGIALGALCLSCDWVSQPESENKKPTPVTMGLLAEGRYWNHPKRLDGLTVYPPAWEKEGSKKFVFTVMGDSTSLSKAILFLTFLDPISLDTVFGSIDIWQHTRLVNQAGSQIIRQYPWSPYEAGLAHSQSLKTRTFFQREFILVISATTTPFDPNGDQKPRSLGETRFQVQPEFAQLGLVPFGLRLYPDQVGLQLMGMNRSCDGKTVIKREYYQRQVQSITYVRNDSSTASSALDSLARIEFVTRKVFFDSLSSALSCDEAARIDFNTLNFELATPDTTVEKYGVDGSQGIWVDSSDGYTTLSLFGTQRITTKYGYHMTGGIEFTSLTAEGIGQVSSHFSSLGRWTTTHAVLRIDTLATLTHLR